LPDCVTRTIHALRDGAALGWCLTTLGEKSSAFTFLGQGVQGDWTVNFHKVCVRCQRGQCSGLRIDCLDCLSICCAKLSSIIVNVSESQKLAASHEFCLSEWGVGLRLTSEFRQELCLFWFLLFIGLCFVLFLILFCFYWVLLFF